MPSFSLVCGSAHTSQAWVDSAASPVSSLPLLLRASGGCIPSACALLPSLPTPSLPLFQNGGVKSLREMKTLGSIPSGQCSKEAINTLLLL